MENIVPLDLMAAGEVGQIVQVDGSPDVVHRLAEMGLREQARVVMIQPGSPCIIAVGDHRLSLRTGDEVEILVVLTNHPLTPSSGDPGGRRLSDSLIAKPSEALTPPAYQ